LAGGGLSGSAANQGALNSGIKTAA